MKLIVQKQFIYIFGKKALQPLLHKLYLFAATSMNYGIANRLDIEYTGEKKVIEYIARKSNIKRDFVFFDVGANSGKYSVLVTRIFAEEKPRVYAFEPSTYSFNALVKNTDKFNNIKRYNFGFGKKEETVTLWANWEGSGASTLYHSGLDNYSLNKGLSETISIKVLDEFCAEHGINAIDFLKIDVEGHELFILQGAESMLKQKRIQFIQFEFGPFNVYSRTFFKDFWDLLSPSYTISRVINDGLFEIKAYSENLEIFRTANFLAELKDLTFPSLSKGERG